MRIEGGEYETTSCNDIISRCADVVYDSAVSTPGSGRQCKCRARGSKDIQYRAGRDIQ